MSIMPYSNILQLCLLQAIASLRPIVYPRFAYLLLTLNDKWIYFLQALALLDS